MIPVLDFHESWSAYSKHIWIVFMLKWYLDKYRNVLKFEFQILSLNTKTVENLGAICSIEMNAHPLS